MKDKMNIYILFLMALLLLYLAGCGPHVQIDKSYYHRSVQSDDGVAVQVPDHPQRILALSSAYDTILLGLVDPSRLAGVNSLSTYEQYSLEAHKAKHVKTVMRSYSLEKIIALHPDVVIAPEYITRDVIEGLRYMGIPTVVVNTGKTVEGVINNVETVATLVNESERGDQHVASIRQDIERMRQLGSTIDSKDRKRVLFVSSMDGYTGRDSLFDDMCRYMYIDNAPTAMGYPSHTSFTDERVIAMNPDYIFIPAYKGLDKNLSDRFLKTPAFHTIPAMVNHHVEPLPAAYLYTANQHIGNAMLSIMYVVYPQLERKSHE